MLNFEKANQISKDASEAQVAGASIPLFIVMILGLIWLSNTFAKPSSFTKDTYAHGNHVQVVEYDDHNHRVVLCEVNETGRCE